MKKLRLEVKIDAIDVTTDYYEISYSYSINSESWEFDIQDGDYENGETPKQWKETLESGLAMKFVMEKIADDNDFEV